LLDPAVVVERALGAPDVEMAAEVLEAGLDAGSNLLGSPPADGPGRDLRRPTLRHRPEFPAGRSLGHVVDVFAVVAVLGDLVVLADCHNGSAEVLDLIAEVVEASRRGFGPTWPDRAGSGVVAARARSERRTLRKPGGATSTEAIGEAGIGGRRDDVRGDRFGDLHRRAAVRLGELEGDVAGEVAEARVRRAFDRDGSAAGAAAAGAGRSPGRAARRLR
jgi:hypothetical protein